MTALPDDVPLQLASWTAVTVYVVVAAGETLRVVVDVAMPFCVTPSDHVTDHGAVPVRLAWIVWGADGQPLALPLTVAVGRARRVTTVAADVPLQPFAFVTVT